MNRTKLVRAVALILAIIMAGGVLIAAFSSVSALDAGAQVLTSPDTGTDGPPVVPIVICVVGVLLVAACAIVPKFSKK